MGEVYAFNGRSHSVSVFDASSGKVAATIPLPGKPEFAVYDSKTGRIYDNIEDKNEVAVIDPATHQVTATWPIAPAESPSGMAMDAKHHRLFIGCDAQMLMLNTKTGKVIATVPIGDGVDANVFDPETKLAFASCGDGTVTIAKEDGDKLTDHTQILKTERGARTMALDPTTHKIYLATAEFETPANPETPLRPAHDPKVIPGTFKILVYGLDEMR